jgi:hypothetical protein
MKIPRDLNRLLSPEGATHDPVSIHHTSQRSCEKMNNLIPPRGMRCFCSSRDYFTGSKGAVYAPRGHSRLLDSPTLWV